MNKEQQEVLDDAYNRYRATIIKEFYEVRFGTSNF